MRRNPDKSETIWAYLRWQTNVFFRSHVWWISWPFGQPLAAWMNTFALTHTRSAKPPPPSPFSLSLPSSSSLSLSYTHIYTHARARARAHARTHTHSLPLSLSFCPHTYNTENECKRVSRHKSSMCIKLRFAVTQQRTFYFRQCGIADDHCDSDGDYHDQDKKHKQSSRKEHKTKFMELSGTGKRYCKYGEEYNG